MVNIELILTLLVAVCVLALAARGLRVPYPILLVVGGLVLALLPFVPDIELAPDLVFLLFLPPLLYIAGFNTSIREVRAQLPAIASLAVGLVLATIIAVAAVTHTYAPALGWPLAFALGAIVSPPDAVAATALLRGLGVPRRVLTLLDGESLFNDATALVAYQAALAAAATAAFSPTEAVGQFLFAGFGGIAIGAIVGWLVVHLRGVLHDPAVEITIGLLTPWAAYLPAEHFHVSGVLATATAGLTVGWASPRIMDSETRIRARAVWDMVVFILNSLVFILIGLQLSTILRELSGQSLQQLVMFAALVSAVVIVIRIAWVFGDRVVNLEIRRVRKQPVSTLCDLRETFVVGWAGMRGVVSLATALALPLSIPGREAVIFVTFAVILVTLVGQGMSLPTIIRALGVSSTGDGNEHELRARSTAAEAAIHRIDELAEEWPAHLPLIDALRAQYEHRATHLGEYATGEDTTTAEQELIEHQKIRQSVIAAERAAVLSLRNQGAIDDEAWQKVQRDLDLEELRMEA
jgi:CPA1 family monovalent cation:H+ antiporter